MIKDAIMDYNYVDIYPSKVVPTWDNGRVGVAYVTKRLDRYLLHEQVVERLRNVQSEVVNNYISDHKPIILH